MKQIKYNSSTRSFSGKDSVQYANAEALKQDIVMELKHNEDKLDSKFKQKLRDALADFAILESSDASKEDYAKWVTKYKYQYTSTKDSKSEVAWFLRHSMYGIMGGPFATEAEAIEARDKGLTRSGKISPAVKSCKVVKGELKNGKFKAIK